MNIWITMVLGGLITFGMRFSFIFLFGRFEIPETLRRALRFVPPAVFSAIVFPEVFLQSNHLELSLDNHRLLAGLIAVIVAQMTKNTLITILAGMAVLVLLQVLFQ